MAQRITRLTTDQKIAGSNPAEIEIFQYLLFCPARKKRNAPPGGLEPPTFRLTAERASRLRHGGKLVMGDGEQKLKDEPDFSPKWTIVGQVETFPYIPPLWSSG